MNLWSLTYEKVEELKKQEEEKQTLLEILKNKKVEDIWKEELEELLNKYEEWYELKNEINNEQVVVKTQKKKAYLIYYRVPRKKYINLMLTLT